MGDVERFETVRAWTSERGAALRRWVERRQARAVNTRPPDTAKTGDIAVPESRYASKTDLEWERFGQTDPYFGVIAYDKFHRSKLTDETIEEFFRTGDAHVDDVMAAIRHHIDPHFKPKAALDFGCGVGRTVIPLSSIADHVTAADVSQSMLVEAKRNCRARGIGNVDFVKTEGTTPLWHQKFDFVHSFIVLQHIPAARGQRIFANLVSALQNGGICAIHVTYARDSAFNKAAAVVKRYVPFGGNLLSLARGARWDTPRMEMHRYDLNLLFHVIQQARVERLYCEYTDHSHELGVFLYFQKPNVS
jgi:Cyclopropane fatty acid synthase and related methyltransferases